MVVAQPATGRPWLSVPTTTYDVTGEPPSKAGAVQRNKTDPSVATPEKVVGGFGAPPGVPKPRTDSPGPTSLMAYTATE